MYCNIYMYVLLMLLQGLISKTLEMDRLIYRINGESIDAQIIYQNRLSREQHLLKGFFRFESWEVTNCLETSFSTPILGKMIQSHNFAHLTEVPKITRPCTWCLIAFLCDVPRKNGEYYCKGDLNVTIGI